MLSTLGEVAVSHSCLLGEGPLWEPTSQSLFWVDILQRHIHQYFPKDGQHRTYTLPQFVGAVALRSEGGLVVALQNGFAFFDPVTGVTEHVYDPEAHLPNNRFNDGKADPAGRFWAGTMALSEEPGAGNLYVLETDGSVSLKVPGVTISNGLAWSPDHRQMYYIDTPTSQVVAYQFDVDSGQISDPRVVIIIPVEEGFPDGMTIDEEGMLWIALWGGWKVMRWNPYTGELLHRITLPAANITSCTFGGPNLNDLYITSARVGLTEEELAQQPSAGSVFVVKDVGIRGFASFTFNG